jgi:DNA-binding CsgD family transcriptional regulator
MTTLIETLETQRQNLIRYDKMLSNRLLSLEEIGRSSPFIFHYNDEDFKFRFVNEKASSWFCLSNARILEMGEGFVREFYHPDTIKNEFPKIKRFYSNHGSDVVYSNYHQIYNPSIKAFSVCLAFVKKCSCLSGFVSIILPLENAYLISKKMNRIISEELFKINHLHNFEDLTIREGEILKLLAEGMNNPQISCQLFISRRTVEQHRKNINRKLDIHTFKDILDYAYAFDLI